MGYLFENMEKMDIQQERRNTAQAREALAQVQEEVRKEQENTIRAIVKICQKLKASKEQALREIMEASGKDREYAQKKVDFYWKM